MRVVNTANPPADPYDFGRKACSNSLMTRKSVGSPIVNAIKVIMSPRRLRSSMNLVAIMARLGIHDPRPSRPESSVAGAGGPTWDGVTAPSRQSAWSPCATTAAPRGPSPTG